MSRSTETRNQNSRKLLLLDTSCRPSSSTPIRILNRPFVMVSQFKEIVTVSANCFCAPNYQSYTNSLRGSPTAGCYAPVEIQANYRLASNKCKMFNNGFLSYDESADKSSFLTNQFLHSGSMFLIGYRVKKVILSCNPRLVYDNVDGRWEWADGSSPGSYQPWASGYPPNGANSQTCAFVDSNLNWQATDCRNGYLYVCEAPPLDSMHYYY